MVFISQTSIEQEDPPRAPKETLPTMYDLPSEDPEEPGLPDEFHWLADLEIGLGIWEGVFEEVPSHWLRWCDREGNWLLTDTEQERREKEQAQTQLRQAAGNLLATGMGVSQVAEILGLSEEQVREVDS